MSKIGFIGLGVMGKPMARNLLKNGYKLKVFDRHEENIRAIVNAGAEGSSSIQEIAQTCSTIITMLPNSPNVKSACLEEGGIIHYATPGTLVIDMSSIAPAASKEISAALGEKGIRMLDAPVSGGEPKAIDGSLAIMVGGTETDFEEAKPLFAAMGSTYILVGDIGAGNTCKLTNQVIVALNIAALSEGMMLAKKAGADPEKVFNAIKAGLAGSTVMNAKTPMILAHDFKPGFRIDLHIKDLNNALDTGAAFGAPLPMTEQVQEIMKKLSADGFGSEDHSAIAKHYEQLAGTEFAG